MGKENHIIISVIIPLYNEGDHIYNSIHEINNYLKKVNIDYELLVIDDGSKDNTYNIVKELTREIRQLKILKLSRNFGKEYALCAGLEICTGDACIVMDSDLQHPPMLIPQMVELWKQGYDVVECVKTSRGKEKMINRIGAEVFYGMLKKVSGFDLRGASDFKLLDRKVINSWRTMSERNTFFRGMSAWLGYNRVQIPFDVPPRAGGETHWSISNLIRLAVSAVTSFSSAPLHIITVMGNLFLISSIILGIYAFALKLLGKSVDGFTTVILLLLIIGSLLMISFGILGEYIARIYEEIKHRPRYIIEEIVEENDDSALKENTNRYRKLS
ncbi:glycosyltransferase family 2 protein [uncultured Clostridium sp.]|uniref:glycosyltransferase family 2 protein n=1 Tax=uncultured Clostridium sp. TaxID=59620 RepID=UPI0028EA4014|nr:glycosyltransferase family 2 protein [uncultured Clostridium sp.]